jgi:cyanophycinase
VNHGVLGPLVMIGGHEQKQRPAIVLSHLVRLAGGVEAHIGVVPTASEDPDAAARPYREAFLGLGARTVRVLNLASRGDAEDPAAAAALDELSAVFFTGGDQLRITSTLGGTRFHYALRAAHQRGLVVAGTSAGASMMSDTMIVGGDAERAPTRNTVHLAVGMGFWSGVVVDQHFSQRGRLGRLLAALAQNPAVLGVGIDEDTAIVVDLVRRRFTVHGQATVSVLDGEPVRHTNASETRSEQPLVLSPVTLHVLPAGWGYSWSTRRPCRILSAEEDAS